MGTKKILQDRLREALEADEDDEKQVSSGDENRDVDSDAEEMDAYHSGRQTRENIPSRQLGRRDSPHKDEGPKCFRCDQFGHISTKCENLAKADKREDKVNRVAADDDTVVVRVNGSDIPAILDTGCFKTLLREDGYRKIGSPTIRPTARVFQGFGNARSKATGVFNAKLSIHSEVYDIEVYVILIDAMDVEMLLGKDLQRQMDIRIIGGQTTIRKLPRIGRDESHVGGIEDRPNPPSDVRADEDTAEWLAGELSMINYVEPCEIGVRGAYEEKIRRLRDNHTLNQQVQTDIEMKIVLKDQEPVRSKPRRLSVRDKEVLQKQNDEWLNDGTIRPSRSTYSSAVVITTKKD